jgi:hypothetical protein
MDARHLAVATAAAALAVPAAVLADGLGPHTTWYDQHPHSTKPHDDVSIVVHRDKGRADVFVSNSCLGTESSNGIDYPDSAGARGVRVRHGKIAFNGKATIYRNTGQEKVAMKFAATLKPKKATGSAKFPGKSCGTIQFTSKLAKRTK